MRNFQTAKQQQGAVLLVAMVMLLILTLLAVSNMRGVTLESRITANRAETQRLHDVADAALREGEFRFYGPANLRHKLEHFPENCTEANKLDARGNNKPCLLKKIEDADDLKAFVNNPIAYQAATGNTWMEYRGLDPDENHYFTPDNNRETFWNSYLITSSADESEALNVEYGAVLEGRGTFYYLVNGQANDELAVQAVQSTTANIYVGLNN